MVATGTTGVNRSKEPSLLPALTQPLKFNETVDLSPLPLALTVESNNRHHEVHLLVSFGVVEPNVVEVVTVNACNRHAAVRHFPEGEKMLKSSNFSVFPQGPFVPH